MNFDSCFVSQILSTGNESEKHFAMRIFPHFLKSLFYHLKLHESLNICQENDNRLLNSEVGNVHNTVKLRKSAVVPRMDKGSYKLVC